MLRAGMGELRNAEKSRNLFVSREYYQRGGTGLIGISEKFPAFATGGGVLSFCRATRRAAYFGAPNFPPLRSNFGFFA